MTTYVLFPCSLPGAYTLAMADRVLVEICHCLSRTYLHNSREQFFVNRFKSAQKKWYLSSMKTSNFLARGGEMGASTATFDWTTTSLGPIENWQPNLRITLATMLPSPLPMFLWWGPELISFYNDAFRLLADGEKFACALGLPAQRAWPTIWQMLAPEVSIVLTTGEGRLCQGRT